MKIALAHKRLDLAGGTERDFYRTAEGLRDLGHEVHLFCAEYGVSAPDGIQAHRVPSLPLGRTARLLSFAFLGPRTIAPHQCDVVISFGRMVRQDILRSGGGSHLVFLRKMEPGRGGLRRLLQNFSLYHRSVLAVERLQYQPQNYRKILAVSHEVKDEITATYGVPEERVAVIYNGVDQERFHPRRRAGAREKIRQEWGIPPQAPVVLFVGHGFQRKGLDRLLRVWGSSRLAGFFLLVVGEDLQRARYTFQAQRQADGRVVFAGPRDDTEDFHAAADLLILPAFQEAFGNVVLEALASGLPVIVSRAVGAAEILTGNLKEGILSSPDDPVELENKILWMVHPERWPRLSQEARKLSENYSWKSHFRQFEGHLTEVAEQVRRGRLAEVFFKSGSSSLWMTRNLSGGREQELLRDPDELFALPGCEVIKDQQKIKVGRLPLKIGGKTRRVYLKRYNAYSWRYRVLSLFLPSGARRSWMGAGVLLRAGFQTGQPVAAVEYRSWGMLRKSFYLSEEIPGKMVDAYWREDLRPMTGPKESQDRRGFLKNLGALFRSLHRLNIYHNDLKDANILVVPGPDGGSERFYLLDLEGIRRYRKLSQRRRVKNLVQLNRTFGRYLRWTEKLTFLQSYLGQSFSDRMEKREWITKVLDKSRRWDQRHIRKLPSVEVESKAAHEF